jgi:hypothetical protein
MPATDQCDVARQLHPAPPATDYVSNECLLALRGCFLLVEFDDAGSVASALRLGGHVTVCGAWRSYRNGHP